MLSRLAFGVSATAGVVCFYKRDQIFDRFVWEVEVRRDEIRKRLLPKRIILIRHGESEGNVNKFVYEKVPDNALELTQVWGGKGKKGKKGRKGEKKKGRKGEREKRRKEK